MLEGSRGLANQAEKPGHESVAAAHVGSEMQVQAVAISSEASDPIVDLIRGGQRHWIINGSWLTANGYAWPDDVNIVPSADLAAIPEGAPIQ